MDNEVLAKLQELCYAIAGIVAIVGSIDVYIDMNNEPGKVRRTIIRTVAVFVLLVAIAAAIQ